MIIRERTGMVSLAIAVVLAITIALVFRGTGLRAKDKVPWDHPYVERDLDLIRTDSLRILVMPDPLTWEQRKGQETGLEFEMLERFAVAHQVALRIIVCEHPDSMLFALQRGEGDVIAAQFTTNTKKRSWVSITEPYMFVTPMLAQLREDPLAIEMEGGSVIEVGISAWSPFIGALSGKRRKQMIVSTAVPEELLMQVVIGSLPAAVVTDALAGHEGKRFPALEFSELEGGERPLGFAVRNNAPLLLAALNDWLRSAKEVEFRNALIAGYVGNLPRSGALRKKAMPASRDSISPYDADFREFGSGSAWSWQLLAAMAWKESRFDSTAVSNKGAHGILQLMPRTANRFGLDSTNAVRDHIGAARRYVERLDTLWMRAVPDREQRLRFVLASYNAGLGHIIDAQRLAERLGLDPKRWEHNVERAVQLLSKPRYYDRPEIKNGYCKGEQVFHYVRDVTALYQQLLKTTGGKASSSSAPKGEEATSTRADDPDTAFVGALLRR